MADEGLSITRPVILGAVTFFILDILIAFLVNTPIGRTLLPGHSASSLTSAMRNLVHLGHHS
jgi:hypothetical protein